MKKILFKLFKIIFPISVFLILGLVVFLTWFGKDFLFTGTDVYFPISRISSIYRNFFTWSTNSTGSQSTSMSIMLPYGLFLIISEKLNLPLPFTQHLWYYYIFVLSGFSAYLFSKTVIKKIFNVDTIIPPVIAGIFYMANPFVAVMSSTYTPFWLTYASMPLKLYLVIIGFGSSQKLKDVVFRVLLWLLISSSSYGNPKYLILDIIPYLILMTSYLLFEKNKLSIKHTLIYFIQFLSLLIIFNLYWLIPQIYLIKNSIIDTRQVYELVGVPRLLNYLWTSASGVLNGFILIGHKPLPDYYGSVPYYKYSNYLFSPLYKVVGLLPIFLLMFVAISKKKIMNYYIYVFCTFTLIFSVFGMLGATSPASEINSFFVNKIPLFLDLFSNPYPIFSIYYLVALSTIVSIGIFILKSKKSSLVFIPKAFTVTIVIILLFFIGRPVWTGELVRKSSYVENEYLTSHLYKIPDYYYSIKKIISPDDIYSRILSIPYPKMGVVVYQWKDGGYSGAEIGSGWIGNILSGANLATEKTLNKIKNGEVITNDLTNLGIKYIIFHNDANFLMFNGTKIYGGEERIFEKNIVSSLVNSHIKYQVTNYKSAVLYTLQMERLNPYLLSSDQNLSQKPLIRFFPVNPVKINVTISKAYKPFVLLFPQTYNKDWLISDGRRFIKEINLSHQLVNDYANGWYVDPQKICVKIPKLCTVNNDGTFNINLSIEFLPQRFFYIGLFISSGTLFLLIGYFIYDFLKQKK